MLAPSVGVHTTSLRSGLAGLDVVTQALRQVSLGVASKHHDASRLVGPARVREKGRRLA